MLNPERLIRISIYTVMSYDNSFVSILYIVVLLALVSMYYVHSSARA